MESVKTNNCLKSILFILLIFVFTNCGRNNIKKSSHDIDKTYQEVKITRVKFNFDQLFEIKEIKKGKSVSDIQVKGVGFQNNSKILKFESVDPLESFLIGDIDADGFEELYLITRSKGSNLKTKLIGIVSVDGKNYKIIYIPENDKTLNIQFDYLEGYMGFDSIYLKEMKLCRDFPVFKHCDTDPIPTGEIRRLMYKLVNFNNSYSLQVQPIVTSN